MMMTIKVKVGQRWAHQAGNIVKVRSVNSKVAITEDKSGVFREMNLSIDGSLLFPEFWTLVEG